MPWLLHMPGSDSHQVLGGTSSAGDTRPAMTPGVARSACEAQDTCESLVRGMAGAVSPQLPAGTRLPVRTGWSSPPCSAPGEGQGPAGLCWGTGTPSQGSQCHLAGDSERSGVTRGPSPGAVGVQSCPARPSLFPHRPASRSPINPARPASSPPTPAHPWRLCKAPPRQGQRNSLQVQLVNHIKSSPVESLGVHPAQGECRELVRDPQSCRELKPLKPLQKPLKPLL